MTARGLPAAVLVTLLGVASAASAALSVTLLTGAGRSGAGDGVGGPDVTNVVPFASPPFASGPVSASDGGGTSTTTYTFTNQAWVIEFDHARPGNGSGVYVWSDDYFPGPGVTFSVSEPVVALVSGGYDVADTGSGDNVLYDVIFYANNTRVHETYNLSVATPNESFVVGQAGGDHDNFVVGDTVQVLLPGVTYALDWYASLQDGHPDPGDVGASATGSVRVDFLPEPGSALMLGAGVAALGALGSRRRTMAR